jgi:hypothetical protein
MAIFSLQIPVLRIIVRAGARPVFATASLEEKNYTKEDEEIHNPETESRDGPLFVRACL